MLQRMTAVEKPADLGNEETLIARIRNGETSLFATLVKPYERRVYMTALALLRNQADAEDVAQEAILKAFTHLNQFRGESRFSTWLIQITVNEARMRQRNSMQSCLSRLLTRRDKERKGHTRRATSLTGAKFRPKRWKEAKSGLC
jgi:RNA polymerase sigma factor (sigma-70 family)